jgi:hypothetical protein
LGTPYPVGMRGRVARGPLPLFLVVFGVVVRFELI